MIEEYEKSGQGQKPLTILNGMENGTVVNHERTHIKLHHVKTINEGFGRLHSKMGVYVYNDNSLRVVVGTGPGWNSYCQWVWISPLCPALKSDVPYHKSDSPTKFKEHLIGYFKSFRLCILQPFINFIKNADFSDIRVFLITSIPGRYPTGTLGANHISTLRDILRNEAEITEDDASNWDIVLQAATIGYLGTSSWNSWLVTQLLACLQLHKNCLSSCTVTAKLVYPTVTNILDQNYGLINPYHINIQTPMDWIRTFLYYRHIEGAKDKKVLPHLKMCYRISQCKSKLAWFLLTSANISKSGWGQQDYRNETDIFTRAHEAGVLFLPKYFEEKYFQIKPNGNQKLFPFVDEVPLYPYGNDDQPYQNETWST